MKKTSSPQNLYSSQRKQKSAFQEGDTCNGTSKNNHKSHPALKYFRVAVKKFSGIFTIFLFSQRKAASKSDITDGSRNKKDQIRGVSCEFHWFRFAFNSRRIINFCMYKNPFYWFLCRSYHSYELRIGNLYIIRLWCIIWFNFVFIICSSNWPFHR